MIRPPGLWTPKTLHSYNPIPRGCVLYLPLWAKDLSGDIFKSADTFGHICTVTNTTWTSTGRDMTGIDKIVILDHTAFDIITALTVMQWVKVTDITGASYECFFSKYVAVGNNREWRIDKNTTDGKVAVLLGDPVDGTYEGRRTTDAEQLVNNTWVLVGFTFNAGTVIIYINGVAVDSTTVEGVIPATLFNGSAIVQLGSQEAAAYITGSLGEGWVYDRVFPAGEALYLTNATKWRYA